MALKCLSLLKKRSGGSCSGEEGAKCRLRPAAGQRLDVGERALLEQALAEHVAVVGAVCEQDLAGFKAAQHVGGAAAIVSLPFGELQDDWQAVGIDEGVDLGGQPASRAPHALGSRLVPRAG